MTLSEYSRPTRVAFNGQGNTPVKVSFITLNDQSGTGDRICFNIGKELYFYVYKGVRKAADLTKPIDKRVYKGTFPTCHDFNQLTATTESVMLLVGFTAGQVQLIDPIKKELSKLYNEERLIDRSKVTCIRWIPGSPNQFLVSHASGQMYVYNEELPCGTTSPHYQLFKQGEGFSVHTCKTKSTRNPLYRWLVGEGSINEFAFSPCSKYLATVSQDGFMRVFDYNSMELVGMMKSYFGGLLCVCWSPDSKYIVTGGEDDLVTVWSFHERRVVCRGQGHKSWVNVVAFDKYTTSVCDNEMLDFSGSDDDFNHTPHTNAGLLHEALRTSTRSNTSKGSSRSIDSKGLNMITSYRFGSVGQDTMLCLWDLTEDILRMPVGRHRTSTVVSQNACCGISPKSNNSVPMPNCVVKDAHLTTDNATSHHGSSSSGVTTSLTQKFATFTLGDRKDKDHDRKEHKRNFSLGSKNNEKVIRTIDDSIRLLGTPSCPRLDDVLLLEPLVCKKVAHERLTALVFHEDCMVAACQEGYVYTWARPGKV
ncbi:WD repeat-containing protein 20, partial [Lamellibrachia satsuma]